MFCVLNKLIYLKVVYDLLNYMFIPISFLYKYLM